jgi:hypothetical protein
MPRKITEKMSLEEIEDEILYTEAALAADPDAEDLLKITEGWLALLDGVRERDRGLRRSIAGSDAKRVIADSRLDRACTSFGNELLFVLGKDTDSPRYKQFFDLPVSRFVRMSLPRQIARVRSWLSSEDAVFQKHKPDIAQWVGRADEALVATRALGLRRGETAIAREELAEGLTRERDGLEAALGARARERNLGRDWPKSFFRVGPSGRSAPQTAVEDELPSDASAGHSAA